MDRSAAARLVSKLQAITADRGATGPEAAVAAAKAKALIDRFGLTGPPPPTAPRRRAARPAPTAGFAGWVGGLAQDRQAWAFDWQTGTGSSNVKVHRYRDRHNWKIEIGGDA